MIRSRVFVFLAISLFFAGCLSAEADGDDPPHATEKEKAEKDVGELQKLTAGVLGNAQKISSEAESVKTNVDDYMRKAVHAEAAAKTAALSIAETNRKEEADAVAKKATAELGKCDRLHKTAKQKAEAASTALKDFVSRALALNNRAQKEMLPASSKEHNYPQVILDAKTAEGETTTLSADIDASTDLSAAQTALSALRDGANKIQLFNYQVESIAIVAKIEAALKTAETDIQSIQGKTKEINSIAQAMNTECERAPDSLKISLRSLCTTANSQLQSATTKLQEAQQCSNDVQERKTLLDATFKAVKDTTDEDTAKAEAANVEGHETFINGKIEKITQALGAITNALSSANGAQGQMQNKMSQHSSQLATELNKGRQQDNVRTPEVTNPILNTGAQNPAITVTDKTELEKSENTMDKTSGQQVDATVDHNEQTKSSQVTDKEKQNPKDDKSQLLNKDQLRNITKDITNNPLIGGEVPTRSAANDSAVTVFIPLLVILVISAVLH